MQSPEFDSQHTKKEKKRKKKRKGVVDTYVLLFSYIFLFIKVGFITM
jgi:hypothetical protein